MLLHPFRGRIDILKKYLGFFFQMRKNWGDLKKKFFHLLPIEFKPVSFAKEMPKPKILPQFLSGIWSYYRGSQTWYIQSHLVKEFTVPFFAHRYPLVYLLCNIFKYLLDSCIEVMKNRSPCSEKIIRGFLFKQTILFSIKKS